MLPSRLFSGRLFADRKTSNPARVKGYTLRPLANFKTIGSSSMLKWLVRLFIVMMLGAVLGVASLIGICFYISPSCRTSAPCAMSNWLPHEGHSRDGN